MITYHGASNQVALICKANPMHHRIFPMGHTHQGRPIEDWFTMRGELCSDCWDKQQAKAES